MSGEVSLADDLKIWPKSVEILLARLTSAVQIAQTKLDRVWVFMNAVEAQYKDRAPKDYVDRRGTCAQLVSSARSCQNMAERRIGISDLDGALEYISSGEEKLRELHVLADSLLEYEWIVSIH